MKPIDHTSNEAPRFPRLSQNERLILEMLQQEANGLSIKQIATRLTAQRMKPGSVQRTLRRMAIDKGLVSDHSKPAPKGQRGPHRKIYQILEQGRKVLSYWSLKGPLQHD